MAGWCLKHDVMLQKEHERVFIESASFLLAEEGGGSGVDMLCTKGASTTAASTRKNRMLLFSFLLFLVCQ